MEITDLSFSKGKDRGSEKHEGRGSRKRGCCIYGTGLFSFSSPFPFACFRLPYPTPLTPATQAVRLKNV